ncbi:hypothetical protein GGI43DRAFT_316918 [Trichoderma evansii]
MNGTKILVLPDAHLTSHSSLSHHLVLYLILITSPLAIAFTPGHRRIPVNHCLRPHRSLLWAIGWPLLRRLLLKIVSRTTDGPQSGTLTFCVG